MSFSIKSLVRDLLGEPVENAVSDIDRGQGTQAAPADPRLDPRATSLEVIALDELQFPALKDGVQYWRQLCGKRRFPRREDLAPRKMARLLRHTALVKVLAEGGDYEYRIVGDAIASAYSVRLENRRLSDYEAITPASVQSTRCLFGAVVNSRMPRAFRRRTGHDAPEANFIEAESVLLPLGVSDAAVDHLLVFSYYLWDSAGC